MSAAVKRLHPQPDDEVTRRAKAELQKLLGYFREKGPVPSPETMARVEQNLLAYCMKMARIELDLERRMEWFWKRTDAEKKEIARKAAERGHPAPESLEAAIAVACGDSLMEQMSAEDLAALGGTDGTELSASELDRWADDGVMPWDASSS